MTKSIVFLFTLIPYVCLIISSIVVWKQYTTIQGYESTIQSTRQKRSAEDTSTILLPIFAQISKQYIRKVCLENFRSLHYLTDSSPASPSRKLKKQVQHKYKQKPVKKCPANVEFAKPVLIAHRPYKQGCAYMDGNYWHVCEQSHGYTMLSFKGTRHLNSSSTTSINFLPYPYEGTDNAVFNNTFYYSEKQRIVAYNFRKKTHHFIKISTSDVPLYSNSTSLMDIQADENGIWALYKKPKNEQLSISLINHHTFKIITTMNLKLDTSKLCNLFIKCSILYSVECLNDDLIIAPIHDLYARSDIQGRKFIWKGIGTNVSNVQYDPNSKHISIFANGNIYKVDSK